MQEKCFDKTIFNMNYLKNLIYVIVLLMLSACGSKLLTVYKIDVQQGNALDAEQVEKVQIGMTKEQVQYVLGSPIITDSFHPDRWDYIYLFIPGYGDQERRHLSITFDRDEVIDIAKHNIEAGPLMDTTDEIIEESKQKNKDKELTERQQKEIKELEEQAESLEEVEDALDRDNQI